MGITALYFFFQVGILFIVSCNYHSLTRFDISATPSATEAASAGTGIVESAKVEPLAPEKSTYA